MQFHILSFEGPDPYSRAGGLARRVEGLSETLADLGFQTHLWFIGDPDLPGQERRGSLHLHRWAQWLSRHHPDGVYDGEWGKCSELARTLPPHLVEQMLLPHLRDGGRAVVLAEEWQTADAVAHLHWLLERAGRRGDVTILWNANDTFGFERIDWGRLAAAAQITTVSRYMKQLVRRHGADPLVIPNGLGEDAFAPPDRRACEELRYRFRERTVVAKIARWDPGKCWLGAVEIVAAMKRAGWRPLLIARGGSEPHGAEVLAAMEAHGLKRLDRECHEPGARGLLEALREADGADVVNLRSHLDPEGRRTLFRGAAAVLANSGHEPFGLVGLETMAAGGIACTGCSGEDYAVPGQNAVVLETRDPNEFLGLFRRLRSEPREAAALRRAGQWTAKHFAWPRVVQGVLLPRVALSRDAVSPALVPETVAPRGESTSSFRSARRPPTPAAGARCGGDPVLPQGLVILRPRSSAPSASRAARRKNGVPPALATPRAELLPARLRQRDTQLQPTPRAGGRSRS